MENAPPSSTSDSLIYLIAASFGVAFILKILGPYLFKLYLTWLHYHDSILLSAKALAMVSTVFVTLWCRNKFARWRSTRAVTEKDATSVLLGRDSVTNVLVYLKEAIRSIHMQIIGTTDAGKTFGGVQPQVVQDIEQGRGLVIVDGKSERDFLNQVYAHVVRAGRERDFHVFSLGNVNISSTYNPFCGGTPEQIAERTFSTFNLNHEYYGPVQFSAYRSVIALLMRRGQTPMPGVMRNLLRDKELLRSWTTDLNDPNLMRDIKGILELSSDEFKEQLSGLVTALGHFSQGSTAKLFNTRHPEINLMDAIKRQKIIYFQLPTMQYKFLGSTTGKLLLQDLQSVVSQIQVEGRRPEKLFTVFLDDFNDYLYPDFASLLNKARSANVGVVFSHQSIGDLNKISPEFREIIMVNTNIKIFMRTNDPDTAEHFAKIVGTKTTEKTTSRRSQNTLGKTDTGEQSVREAEEYIVHPNFFKSELSRGEAVVIIPHPKGRIVKKVVLIPAEVLPTIQLPIRDLPDPDLILESRCSEVQEERTARNPTASTDDFKGKSKKQK
jgi:intracellular multiplication protein IcmO